MVPSLGIRGVKESLEEIRKIIENGGGVEAVRIAISNGSNDEHPRITNSTRSRSLINRIKIILRRWKVRWSDLLDVSDIEEASWDDVNQHPEILRTGQVRLHSENSCPSPEALFIHARRHFMLPHFRQLLEEQQHWSAPEHRLHASDLPLIAIGGSGGGFRAMLGYAAFLDAIHDELWNLTTWTSGVSGSCWTLGSLYTHCRLSTLELMEHYRRLTSEQMHPMSLAAFSLVARSRRGNAFLFGPLLRKRRLFEHVKGGSIMDLLSTLTSTYLLLPRHSHLHTSPANQGLSTIGMSWSKSYQYNDLEHGMHPLPVLSAVRVALDDRPSHSTNAPPDPCPPSVNNMQWWEFTPLEAGSCDAIRDNSHGVFTPLWSFSRKYHSGTSTSHHCPEISFSTILGHCTSALAGPLTGYIQALLSTLPNDTIMSTCLRKFNQFLQWKTWEKRWANPIRSSKEWNPWYGMKKSNGKKDSNPKIKLMDAGISNNLPAHIFYTPPSSQKRHRKADIFIAFDASSDTSTPLSLERVLNFGKQRGLKFVFANESLDIVQRLREQEQEHLPPPSRPTMVEGKTISLDEYLCRQSALQPHIKPALQQSYTEKYSPYYCIVLNGYPLNSSIDEKPSFIYVYCPLLPHDCNPGLDPSRSEFAKVYNLLWNRNQTESIFSTVQAGVEEFVVHKIKMVIRRWIQENQARDDRKD
ncbi:unnamed protein product [Sympodiomycopsis kandeliae]